jgi:hypothetical protein
MSGAVHLVLIRHGEHQVRSTAGLGNQHRSIHENRVGQHQWRATYSKCTKANPSHPSISECRHYLTYTHIRLRDFTLDDNLPDSQCQPDNGGYLYIHTC